MEYSTQPAPPKKFGLSESQGSGLRQEAKQNEAAQMLKKRAEETIARETKRQVQSSTPLDLDMIRKHINSYRLMKGIKK